MKQLPNYLIWYGLGSAMKQKEFRGIVVADNLYYVADDADGETLLSGPFVTEYAAHYDAKFMTDTSGT